MQKVLIALAAATLGCATTSSAVARTPDEKAVMMVIDQFVAGFNKGDTALALEQCTDEMSIIDEIPPHAWHGAGTLEKWLADYDANAKQDGITDPFVTCKAPRHLDVRGEYAYVVAPSDYTWKQKGKPMKEEDSLFTFALHKAAGSWKITGWAWANN
jgi:ketosteroid isomerase-like protein